MIGGELTIKTIAKAMTATMSTTIELEYSGTEGIINGKGKRILARRTPTCVLRDTAFVLRQTATLLDFQTEDDVHNEIEYDVMEYTATFLMAHQKHLTAIFAKLQFKKYSGVKSGYLAGHSGKKHLRIGQIEKKLFVMEFKRNSVIALYLAGKSQSAIVRELEHIKVNRKFVYRTINRYNETGSVVKRYGGGPKKTATSPEMVRKVKKRLERNPRRSGNQMAKELNISQSSIRRILQNELQVKAYKKQKAHDLTPNQKKVRFERAKELLRLAASGEFPNIVFSDEKNFPIEQFVNTQNDRVYLTERTYENLKHRLVTRSNYPSQIMVWAAVTATGRSPLVFIEPGVKDLWAVVRAWNDVDEDHHVPTKDQLHLHTQTVSERFRRQNICENLVASMPRRLEDIIGNNGFWTSSQTVMRSLHLAGHHRRLAKKIDLTNEHARIRLAFAQENLNRDWGLVIFSDEKVLKTDIGTYRPLSRLDNTRYQPQNVSRLRQSDRITMSMWGWMSPAGPGEFVRTTDDSCRICRHPTGRSATQRRRDYPRLHQFTSVHDNSAVHKARMVSKDLGSR
ncbi:hypothetical protein ILUMI_10144 [Ignelater luminosus]|uniref:Transposase Tc1-like domain-containing protein n=1 Tax=Ignelater luminosus TaxID=2038154 RepID=A0A8K0D2U5_IGNLU|nr:hypothetical protein ILUMI_10144 [Ignelater luminosus]